MSPLNFIYFGSVFLQVVLNLQETRPPTNLSVFEGRGIKYFARVPGRSILPCARYFTFALACETAGSSILAYAATVGHICTSDVGPSVRSTSSCLLQPWLTPYPHHHALYIFQVRGYGSYMAGPIPPPMRTA